MTRPLSFFVPVSYCLVSRRNRRIVPALLGVLIVAVVTAGGTHGQISSPSAHPDGTNPVAPPAGNEQGGTLREGTDLTDVRGVFRVTGDRMTFFTDGEATRLVCLENLLLERIVRKVAEDSEELVWNVSGTITEYGQSNYLLLKHATRIQGRD